MLVGLPLSMVGVYPGSSFQWYREPMMMLTAAQMPTSDVASLVDLIVNKRRQGWADDRITQWLLDPMSGACPHGCDNALVIAAFRSLEPAPAIPRAGGELKRIAIGAGIVGVLMGLGLLLYRRSR